MTHNLEIIESERQAILLALAHLSLERPGWNSMLSEIALKMDNKLPDATPEMFSAFKRFADPEKIVRRACPPLMTLGKYDEACTVARMMGGGKAAFLIILEGKDGNGCSVQAPPELILHLPGLLRHLADSIERDQSDVTVIYDLTKSTGGDEKPL
jgi:hypothetical protein